MARVRPPFIRLVCWKEDLAAERALLLIKAGFEVEAARFDPAGMITKLREHPPDAMVFDLDRLPSHSRAVAILVRRSKSMGHLPLVFAGGAEDKIARVKTDLPDAEFASWPKVPAAIKRAMKRAPAVLARPAPPGFSGSRLSKKLDLKAGTRAALIGAEDGFVELLGDLAEGVALEPRIGAQTKLVLWFVRASHELVAAFELAGARMPEGCSLWIVYPKRAGRRRVEFTQNDVRAAGNEVGMVDYKICAVDADWSGMKFARRRG